MKKVRISVVVLLGILLVSGLACVVSEFSPPTVGNIPQGWYLSNEDPYGTYYEADGTKSGVIEYTDTEDLDIVWIYYGDIPSELKGHESEGDALVEKAIEWTILEPDETGTMFVAGQTAGYVKMYDSDNDVYELEIVFIMDSTCIYIFTIYDATTEDEAQVMSIINSISYK